MEPGVFVDFHLTAVRGSGMSASAVGASALFRALHAGFIQLPGRFALAFPRLDSPSPQARLSLFRVFAASIDDLAALHGVLKNGDGLGRLYEARFPEIVPGDFAGPWVSFRRARIHSRRHAANSRSSTMRQLDEAGTTWIDMGSRENGQRFRLYLLATRHDTPLTGLPNGYGLSTADAPLALPLLGN
jgi:hypothetical protein